MNILKILYCKLVELNISWCPFYKEGGDEAVLHILSAVEIVFVLLVITSIFFLIIKRERKRKAQNTQPTGGFRRRYERVSTDMKMEYRFEKEGEYKEGVLKDICLNGLKIEVNDDMPEVHQRVEFVLDGKKLKLKNEERVKIGGFVVRAVEKKSDKAYDLGIEFYHLFRNQEEMIEAIIKKKKK